MAYLVKRRAVLREEAPVSLGDIQGDGVAQWMMRCNSEEERVCVCTGEVLRISWTREGKYSEENAGANEVTSVSQQSGLSSS